GVLGPVTRTQRAGEEGLAHRRDLGRQGGGGHPRPQPVVLVEGGGEEREEALVPLLVAANALELGERRVRVLVLGGEVAEPPPAESGGSLGVDLDAAAAPERPEAQPARPRARHLPDARAGRRRERGEQARKRRVP